MKKRCIIHIGMPKTGSTSIQRTLYKNLNDPAFFYAGLGNKNHGKLIASLFLEKGKLYPAYRKEGYTSEDIEKVNKKTKKRLTESINSSIADTMIISGEGLAAALSFEELINMRDFLHKYFHNITIVAYVRPPGAFASSHLQQKVKGGLYDFDLKGVYPYYRKKLEKYDFIFGKENVHIWKFDPKVFFGGDVVLDFCHRLNIKMDPDCVERENESITKEALSLLYIYRKFGPGYGTGRKSRHENAKLIQKLRGIGHTKVQVAPDIVKSIIKTHADDIQWIEDRMKMSFDENIKEKNGCITSEADMLQSDPSSVQALCELLEEDFLPSDNKGETLEEIANLVHALRLQESATHNTKPKG